jgi:hypothetical protein
MKRFAIKQETITSVRLIVLSDCALGDKGQERVFWVPSRGGYIYEVTPSRPGTSGLQVCDRLTHSGSTLYTSTPDRLLEIIRKQARRASVSKPDFYSYF